MAETDEWAQGEIVRAVLVLTKSVNDLRDELRTEIRGLDHRFVSRELFDLTKTDLELATLRVAAAEKDHKELERALSARINEMVSKKVVYALSSLLVTLFLAYATWRSGHP